MKRRNFVAAAALLAGGTASGAALFAPRPLAAPIAHFRQQVLRDGDPQARPWVSALVEPDVVLESSTHRLVYLNAAGNRITITQDKRGHFVTRVA